MCRRGVEEETESLSENTESERVSECELWIERDEQNRKTNSCFFFYLMSVWFKGPINIFL